MEGVDGVFHLAALWLLQCHEYPRAAFDVNVHGTFNVMVSDGVVELWGWVDSEDERKALKIAVEEIDGVKDVQDHLGSLPPYLRGA